MNGQSQKKTTFGGFMTLISYLIMIAAAAFYSRFLWGTPDFTQAVALNYI
jgi:hypothetical protein